MTQQIKSHQLDIDEELLLSGDPSSNLGAATKQYVDDEISNVSGSIGQVSRLATGTNYGSLDNGVFYYSGITVVNPGATLTINLPIANNNGQKVLFSSGHQSLVFFSLTTTQLRIRNTHGSIASSGSWLVIAL